jgi:hypothetical protein
MKTKNSQEAVVFMQTIYLLSTLLGSDKSLNLGQKKKKTILTRSEQQRKLYPLYMHDP